MSTTIWDNTNSRAGVVTYYWIQATSAAAVGLWSSPAAVGWRASDSLMSVLGTNGAAVANGEAASIAKGTDFGAPFTGASVTNTFSITNSGNEAVQITGVTTAGIGAAFFTVGNMPDIVEAGSASNFTVKFNLTAAGLHTAVVTIADDSTTSPYRVNVRGTCRRHDWP